MERELSPREQWLKEREAIRVEVEKELFDGDSQMAVDAEKILFALNYENDRESFYSVIYWWVKEVSYWKREYHDEIDRSRETREQRDTYSDRIRHLEDQVARLTKENAIIREGRPTEYSKYSKIALIKLDPSTYNWQETVDAWNSNFPVGHPWHWHVEG
jgi:hypothetical protein